jgi:flagellar assembly factor FliW
MPIARTAHLGEVEYDPETIVEFPVGLPAFEQERRFLLLRDDRYRPLVFLQSVENEGLAFLAIDVRDVVLEYGLELSDEDLALLGCGDASEGFQAFALITVSETGAVTANLQAPVVFNRSAGKAVQVIQSRSGYSPQHPLGGSGQMGGGACS